MYVLHLLILQEISISTQSQRTHTYRPRCAIGNVYNNQLYTPKIMFKNCTRPTQGSRELAVHCSARVLFNPVID
jgi:hypothetical protein